jgi:hypothetical protein
MYYATMLMMRLAVAATGVFCSRCYELFDIVKAAKIEAPVLAARGVQLLNNSLKVVQVKFLAPSCSLGCE